MRAICSTRSDFHTERLGPLTTFKVSEKLMGRFQENCLKDGWKDGKTATTKGSKNTTTITEDLSHLNKPIVCLHIKLQPNDSFAVFDLTVFTYLSILRNLLSRFLFYPQIDFA